MANWRAEAEQALQAKRFSQAHALCMRVLKSTPNNAHAYYLLSVLAAEHGNFVKAADVVKRALRFDSTNPKYHAHLGKCLSATNRLEQASESARRAAALEPKDALTLDNIGVVLSRAGYHDEALPFYQRATSLCPRVASFQYNLGSTLQFLGDFEGAEAAFTQTLKLQPDFYKAHSSLSQLRKKTPLDNNLDQLRSLFENASADSNARLHLGHAIAKELEDQGDYNASLEWLRRGKAGKLAEIDYRMEEDEQLVKAAMESAYNPGDGGGFHSTEPIFIVGMPRSGTTLVDRIVSNHPSIFSAGELNHFGRALRAQSNSRSKRVIDAETLRASAQFEMASIGQAYLQSTRPRTGNTPRFTDKMPLNFLCCGPILRALPDARIICLRRHPIDTIVSNYRQLFATDFSYYDYSFSLKSTANYYALFDQLVGHWQEQLPADRFTQVHYESVVENLEGEARRLIDFIGLPWDERCLAFQQNRAPVATASSVQVRTLLYTSSIGRWKRYGKALDGVRAILDRRGIKYS